MNRFASAVAGLALAAGLATAATATAASRPQSATADAPGAVYTITNAPTGNAVLAFRRAADGTLAQQGTYPTGGLGSGAGLGSQGAVVLSDDGRQLFAVNAGSDSISFFAVRPQGLQLEATVPSGGSKPISLTLHGSLLYVLDAGGAGAISGFSVGKDWLRPLPGSTRPLGSGDVNPAQVQFSPDGRLLLVTEKGSATIDTYAVGANGRPGAPVVSRSAGATPFGFDFDAKGRLFVSEASGSASSYAVSAGGTSAVSGAVTTHQAAPCWLIVSKNGRYAYTANGGSGTISGFSIGANGSLALLDPSGVSASLGASSHPLDEAQSANGRYLYNLTDGAHLISAFVVGADGSLTPAGTIAVPVGAAGIAAR